MADQLPQSRPGIGLPSGPAIAGPPDNPPRRHGPWPCPVSQHQAAWYCGSPQTWRRLLRCARHSGLGPVLTAPTRPPQPRPPARGPPLWSTRSAPHPRSCGWPLRRRGQTPSRRQRRQYGELARTQQQPQPSWHIRLRSPPPTCPTATSARAPPLGRPASRLRPVFRCLAPCPAPTALPPWHCSELVRQRLNLATPPFGSVPSLVLVSAPSSFCPAPIPPPLPFSAPFPSCQS